LCDGQESTETCDGGSGETHVVGIARLGPVGCVVVGEMTEMKRSLYPSLRHKAMVG
jgi:hypothetical protein